MQTFDVTVKKGNTETVVQVHTDGGADEAKKHLAKALFSGAEVVAGPKDEPPEIVKVEAAKVEAA